MPIGKLMEKAGIGQGSAEKPPAHGHPPAEWRGDRAPPPEMFRDIRGAAEIRGAEFGARPPPMMDRGPAERGLEFSLVTANFRSPKEIIIRNISNFWNLISITCLNF